MRHWMTRQVCTISKPLKTSSSSRYVREASRVNKSCRLLKTLKRFAVVLLTIASHSLMSLKLRWYLFNLQISLIPLLKWNNWNLAWTADWPRAWKSLPRLSRTMRKSTRNSVTECRNWGERVRWPPSTLIPHPCLTIHPRLVLTSQSWTHRERTCPITLSSSIRERRLIKKTKCRSISQPLLTMRLWWRRVIDQILKVLSSQG